MILYEIPEDGNDALFDPCLRFVIKSKLEHQGNISLPKGGDTGSDVTVTTWREAMKRAEEFEKLEERKKEREEEEEKRKGYRDNIITASEANGIDRHTKTVEVMSHGEESEDEQ